MMFYLRRNDGTIIKLRAATPQQAIDFLRNLGEGELQIVGEEVSGDE